MNIPIFRFGKSSIGTIPSYQEARQRADPAKSFAKVVGSAQNVMSWNAPIRDYLVIL